MAEPVIRGDSSIWAIPIVNADTLEPHDLSGCTVWVTVKASIETPDEDAIYQHSMTVDIDGTVTHSDGMTLGEGGAASGIAIQELTPEESVLLTPGDCVYDVQVMTANGRIFTPILNEEEVIVGDITRAITRPE